MATPTIPNGEEHFFPITYEGNGGGQRVGKFVPFTDQATIANSCIFNSADSPVLSRTPSGTGTSKKTFTISVWIKNGKLINSAGDHSRTIYGVNHGGGSRYGIFGLYHGGSGNVNKFRLFLGKYTSGSSTSHVDWYTNRTLEDTSKWYHLMAAVDTTNSTAGDRIKMYIDGERVTSFASSSNPSLNDEFYFGSEYANYISTYDGSYGEYDGYIAELNFVDGQALLPASFGITDTSTGRWIPKTVEPFPTTTTDIAVTVVSSGGNKYALDGVTQDTVTLIEGATYKFDQSDSSNSGHPLRFSTTSDGTHGSGSEYTTGVTTVGTPGSSGAYTQITVATGAPTLYYYCSSHSGMGGTANTQDQYGTNGFRLKFQDSSALGDDTSGNGNDFTSTNLATTDQTTDSPTQNHATLEDGGNGGTLSEGNLKLATTSSQYNIKCATLRPKSGKYYAEFKQINSGGRPNVGVALSDNMPYSGTNVFTPVTPVSSSIPGYGYYGYDGGIYSSPDGGSSFTTVNSTGTTYAQNDIIGIALDLDTPQVSFYKNNSLVITLGLPSGSNGYSYFVGDTATGYSATWECNFGQKSFTYTPPTGFVALQQDNLPETAKGITGFTWIKDRDNALNHNSYDSSNGVFNRLVPNATSTILNTQGGVSKFLKGGIVVGDTSNVNNSGASMVSWNWVANVGTRETNTNGSLTSTVQANTTAGFSIVEFTGTAAAATVGHGLSSAPEWIICKNLEDTASWAVYHKDMSSAAYTLFLNTTAAQTSTSTMWNSTAPTSSVINVGANYASNGSSQKMVHYCWHSVDGFSKFGKYTGNGNADGAFIYTGFQPAWIMIKCFSTSGNGWTIHDNKRMPFNGSSTETTLYANSSQAEQTSGGNLIDFLSNGFKLRGTNTNINGSRTYVYMAFAEHPFVGDGTSPVTAR